jgi:uncharacterized protein (TIGR02145 family)
MRSLLYIAAAVLMAGALPTQARTIKIYTFNGKSRQQAAKQPCLESLPLGCVSFKTDSTWTVKSGDSIEQQWSDVVMATGCKKEDYYGGVTDDYKDDCRQNEGYGDLFSGEMVSKYKDKLCPNGWRVPTRDDYASLITILKNNDDSYFFTRWGASLGGHCSSNSSLAMQGAEASYWSQSKHALDDGRVACFHTIAEPLQFNLDNCSGEKRLGLMLRCVREP